jgi:hypothetical protein
MRSPDLSSSFSEQPLEETAEANGQPEGECVGDKTEDSAVNLSAATDEAAASLDPVTERLMTIMREKAQR